MLEYATTMKKKQTHTKAKQLLVSVTKVRDANSSLPDDKLQEVAGGYACPKSQIPSP